MFLLEKNVLPTFINVLQTHVKFVQLYGADNSLASFHCSEQWLVIRLYQLPI